MPYISFYKDRLPFKPRKNVVIYFDVTGIGIKRYYWTFHDYYYHIVEEFRRNGLQFCFLPKTAQDLELDKISNDSNPQIHNGSIHRLFNMRVMISIILKRGTIPFLI